MSFLSAFKKIGKVLVRAAPVVGIINPALGGIAAAISDAIVRAEVQHTEPGTGALKSEAVQQDFLSSLGIMEEVLELQGKTLDYDKALLQEAIDAQVKFLNTVAKLKGSFKITNAAA